MAIIGGEMCISTTEALHTIKILLSEDIDACCEASMDKSEVSIKLEKLRKYIEKINTKENPVNLNSALDGYY
tara:strand:+ start:749 stop:964 length:216 start_codon:yes stop_codon:yes gene_type:complete